MKVFVATSEGQGARKSDFFRSTEGELVVFPVECARDRRNIDGKCGCRRAMSGVYTGMGTTTFKVIEKEMDAAVVEAALLKSYQAGGLVGTEPTDEERQAVSTDTAELLRLAAVFPNDTVFEKRGCRLQVRLMP